MNMSIKNNLSAMNANRMFNTTTDKKRKSAEKLSSGFRINRAADDAAGLAISEKMRRQIRGLNRAALNIKDGISYCQVADGALNEVHDVLNRVTTLAVQSANETNTDKDREYLNAEVQQLKEECGRIFRETSFNERLIWDSPNEKELIGYEKKRAVEDVYTYSSFDVTAANYDKVPSSVIRLSADAANGISLSWRDYNNTSYTTTPISWDELKEKNYRFKMSDYYGGPDGPNAGLYGSDGNPLYDHTIAFSPNKESSIDEIIAAVNGRTLSTSASIYVNTSWEGTSSQFSSSAGMTYSAAYASQKTDAANGTHFDSADDLFIDPVKHGNTNLSTYAQSTTVEEAKNDSTGWTFDFEMKGVGPVQAKCNSITYYSNDTEAEDEGRWWQWRKYSDGTPYKSTITRGTSADLKGIMNTLTGDHGLLNKNLGEGKSGMNDGVGTIEMRFTMTSATPYSYAGTSSNNVGNIYMSFNVTQSDTQESILEKINNTLNGNTVLDISKSSANNDYAYINTLNVGTNTTNVPIYGGVCKIQIQAGVEAGQFIDIVYDTLGLTQLGIQDTDISTAASAGRAIDEIKKAHSIINEQRSLFGAYQNRLEHAYNINKNSEENTQYAESQIRDTDMAAEMVQYSTHNILEQAGSSMLAQANQSRQGILQLLQ